MSTRPVIINIAAPPVRLARVFLGVLGMVGGVPLLTRGAQSTLALALGTVFIAASFDLLVSGALGHNPLYSPARPRPDPVSGRGRDDQPCS